MEEERENCPCCSKERTRTRSAEEIRALETRINKIIGQLGGVKNMIEENRYCDDILIQLSAIDKAVKSLSAAVFDIHLHTCVKDSILAGDEAVLDEITALFKKF